MCPLFAYEATNDPRIFLLSAACQVWFALLMLAASADIVGKRVSALFMVSFFGVFLVFYLFSSTIAGGNEWFAIQIPAVVATVWAGTLLVRFRHHVFAQSLLAFILFTYATLSVAMTGFVGDVWGMLVFANAVLVTMALTVVLVLAAEQLIASLGAREELLDAVERERDRLQQKVVQSKKMESLGALAAGIAHDFNNMLTGIVGYTNLAMRKLPPDGEAIKGLYMVMSGARQAVDLTSQMLAYTGKGPIHFEPLDVTGVANRMRGLVESVVARKTRVLWTLGGNLPRIRGDAGQLGQVLMNLAVNAAESLVGREGGTIETGLADVDAKKIHEGIDDDGLQPGEFVYVRVRDDGTGVDPRNMGQIFDPFFSEKNRSQGLDLSSLSGIVRQHGGFVDMQSTPGRGSVFTAFLPPLLVDEDRGEPGVAGRQGETIPGEILLADDDVRIRELIVDLLSDWTIVAVADGREAADRMEQDPSQFRLEILDCNMPRMSGPDVYARLRQADRATPVILMSGYHEDQVLRDITKDPNARYLQKPFNIELLKSLVDGFVGDAPIAEGEIGAAGLDRPDHPNPRRDNIIPFLSDGS